MGGGRRRLRRHPAREAGRAPFSFSSWEVERQALDLSFPVFTAGVLDSVSLPGPSSRGSRILTSNTGIQFSETPFRPRMQRLGRERR